ncbi:helix-turn-helix domain-containing protein [Zobellia nedashkovskayae]|uniref:helix-turn-helix domain-containing protein n=2 Tax=Zobellia nedashkovskayae TaxID=2779510 RepID=UPI001889D761
MYEIPNNLVSIFPNICQIVYVHMFNILIICAEYFKEGKLTVNEICERVGVSRATYYKYLRYQGLKGKLRQYLKD